MKHSKTITYAAIAMLVAGIIYLMIEFFVANAWKNPAYDWANNFVPDLGNSAHGPYMNRNVFSPLYRLMNFGFIFQGILFGSAAILMSQVLHGKIKGSLIIAGSAHAIGLITVAIFHQTANSIQDRTIFINIAGAALALIAGNSILIIAGSQWKKLAFPAWFGWLSIVLGSLAILLGFVLFGNSSVAPGIRERISIDSFIFWQIIAGMILIFNSKRKIS